jgi:hypothetical protein
MNDLPLTDPIERQQAPLLQTLLLTFLIMSIFAAPLTLSTGQILITIDTKRSKSNDVGHASN